MSVNRLNKELLSLVSKELEKNIKNAKNMESSSKKKVNHVYYKLI